MKTSSRLPLIFALAILTLASCSKDKMIEKSLHKKEGIWQIDQVNWTVVHQTENGQTMNSGTTFNAGTFTFDKGGSGKYSYVIDDTISRSGSFTWDVDDETVSIASVSQNFNWNTGTIKQIAVAYSGTQSDKTSLTLEGSETDQEVSGSVDQFVISGTFYLKK